MKRGVSSGEPLPDPWPVFGKNRMAFRRGSLSMIAGPPGSMKTIMALNLVRQMGSTVPTLYHSSDSDNFTMASRSLSMLTGQNSDESEFAVMAQQQAAYESLREMEHVRWSFKASPSIEFLKQEAEAFREIKGEYPHHTIIDILMNVDYEGISEYNYQNLMLELNTMAREQETAITLIHHTSESAKSGTPPPRSAVMGKANQLPTLILTLWGDAVAGKLMVATVKNRFGPQDAMAKKFITMKVDPSICLIEEAAPGEFDGGDAIFRDGPWVDDEDKVNDSEE